MVEVVRFGKVLGRMLGRRCPDRTKADAIAKFGKGISIRAVEI